MPFPAPVRVLSVACAAVLPLLAGAAAAGGVASPGTVRALIALEHRWLTAAAGHDTATLDRILAPDFTDTGWNGVVRDRAMVLAAARRATAPPVPQTLEDLAVRRFGRVALVTGIDASVRGRVRFSDVFVRRAGRWQAVHAQETPIRGAD